MLFGFLGAASRRVVQLLIIILLTFGRCLALIIRTFVTHFRFPVPQREDDEESNRNEVLRAVEEHGNYGSTGVTSSGDSCVVNRSKSKGERVVRFAISGERQGESSHLRIVWPREPDCVMEIGNGEENGPERYMMSGALRGIDGENAQEGGGYSAQSPMLAWERAERASQPAPAHRTFPKSTFHCWPQPFEG